MALLLALPLVALLTVSHTRAQDLKRQAEVWMGPPSYENGKCFRELFETPDRWKETRSVVDVLMYADHRLQKQFTDDELRAWFAQLRQWKMKFALEVGAIKPWGVTAEKTFDVQRPMWDRVQRLGGNIYAIAMDEPLLCCRKHIHQPDDYALRETADFIARVRKHYPNVLIGDIETYPSIPLPDHFWWIESLEKRLAERPSSILHGRRHWSKRRSSASRIVAANLATTRELRLSSSLPGAWTDGLLKRGIH